MVSRQQVAANMAAVDEAAKKPSKDWKMVLKSKAGYEIRANLRVDQVKAIEKILQDDQLSLLDEPQ